LIDQPDKPQLPSLCESADRASRSAQQAFLLINGLQLMLLTLAAFLSGFNLRCIGLQKIIAWSVVAIMLTALCLVTFLRTWTFGDKWFRCRAFSENLKSVIWYFVMSPEALELASVKYLQETKELNNRIPDLQAEFARFDSRGELFTSWMKTSQALPFSKKAPFYIKWRLDDQIGWYSDRAKSNSEREALWFKIIFCIEFVAIVFSILQACQLMRFNPVSGSLLSEPLLSLGSKLSDFPT
jgi:hypothetical protein